MSEQFLNQVLKIEDESVESTVASLLQAQSDSSEPCCICLQKIGMLSSETGVIECEISLPCSHRVGSVCIATWLRTNNTCPVCRRVLFPAQPRPYLEGDVLEDDGVDSMDNEPLETDGWPQSSDNIVFVCHTFCEDLGLSLNALNVALEMAEYLDSSTDFDYSPLVTVSATLYMVSHIMNEHRSPQEIFYLSGIEAQSIRRAYSRIIPSNRH